MKLRPILLLLALACACISGCNRVGYLDDIAWITYTSESGTILPELQSHETVTITRERVTLTRRGKTDDTDVDEGTWVFDVDPQRVTALFEQLETIDCSTIKRLEPEELTEGGRTMTYDIVYAGRKTFNMNYGQGATYTNGWLITRPIDTFIQSLHGGQRRD